MRALLPNMKCAILLLSLAAPTFACAQPSGTFDGRWSATVGPQGSCNFTSILILDVMGSSIVGNATNPSGVYPLSGTVNPHGAGVFKIGGFVGTVRFSGNTFEANYANQCGGRFAIGTKSDAAGSFEDGVAAAKRGDYTAAMRIFRPLADRGDAAAQNILGAMYGHGQGVSQDYAEALKWYRLAADQGNAQAQYNLGFKYENGIGVPQNQAEAVKWYGLAARQGNTQAQNNLEQLRAQIARASASSASGPINQTVSTGGAQATNVMSTEAGIRAQADRIFGLWLTPPQRERKEIWIADRLSEQLDRQRGNSLSVRVNR